MDDRSELPLPVGDFEVMVTVYAGDKHLGRSRFTLSNLGPNLDDFVLSAGPEQVR